MDTVHTDCVLSQILYRLRQRFLLIEEEQCYIWTERFFFFTSNESVCPNSHAVLYVHVDYTPSHLTQTNWGTGNAFVRNESGLNSHRLTAYFHMSSRGI